MKTISFTEFRSRASDLMTDVEHGETIVVTRHGRPIAEITPIAANRPAWKQPALRLSTSGSGLAAAILAERELETVP